jgi:hypothetical protein
LDVVRVLVVSAVTMGLAHTIARERVFEGLRRRAGGKETSVGYMISCPYCLSHWIAFVLVPLTGTYTVPIVPAWGLASVVLSWFLSSVLIAVVAAFLRVLFYFVDETQGLVRREQRLVELETKPTVRRGRRTRRALSRTWDSPLGSGARRRSLRRASRSRTAC